jgi:transcription elongation factor Elf1
MYNCPHCNSKEVELRDCLVESGDEVIQVPADCKTCGSELECEFHFSTIDTTFERDIDQEV